MSVLTVTGDKEGDYNFEDKPLGPSSEHEHRSIVLSHIQGLVSRVGWLAPDNGLNVLCIAECGLHERLTLIELRQVLASKRVETEWRGAEAYQLDERVHEAEEDSEVLRAMEARVDELPAACASLIVGTEQEMIERDTMDTSILELQMQVVPTTRGRELGVVIQPCGC